MQWGYSPKLERYIPLADFSPDKYLVTCLQAFENLGWNISHVSGNTIFAYTPLSWQSYSEEVSVQISAGFAIVKSECVGIQLLFTDYGKNEKNLEDFFHEFDYVEYHLKDIWDERLAEFKLLCANTTGDYYDHSPLAVKNKIKNVLYLFVPRKGYYVTPLLIVLNILLFAGSVIILAAFIHNLKTLNSTGLYQLSNQFYLTIGANNRNLTLSGQYWRLVSHMFVHFSFSHLLFNMYALAYIGLMTENKTGSGKFAATYILSGIVGGAISLAYHPVGVMAGASGAVMGMFGLFLALLVTDIFESNARKALAISTGLVVLIMLFNGSFGKTDNAAHIGGLVSGFIIGLIFTFKFSESNKLAVPFSYITAIAIVAVFVGNILYYTPNYQIEKFEALVKEFNRNQGRAQLAYSYRSGGTKVETLSRIRIFGIENWQKNFYISKQMMELTLPVESARRAERMNRFSRLQLRMNSLLYRECREGTSKYRPEIKRVYKEINQILITQNIENKQ